ncbi:MAG: HAMP domain-containing sensor histidine kinase [Candidatus Zixiibacteriota bacterium]
MVVESILALNLLVTVSIASVNYANGILFASLKTSIGRFFALTSVAWLFNFAWLAMLFYGFRNSNFEAPQPIAGSVVSALSSSVECLSGALFLIASRFVIKLPRTLIILGITLSPLAFLDPTGSHFAMGMISRTYLAFSILFWGYCLTVTLRASELSISRGSKMLAVYTMYSYALAQFIYLPSITTPILYVLSFTLLAKLLHLFALARLGRPVLLNHLAMRDYASSYRDGLKIVEQLRHEIHTPLATLRILCGQMLVDPRSVSAELAYQLDKIQHVSNRIGVLIDISTQKLRRVDPNAEQLGDASPCDPSSVMESALFDLKLAFQPKVKFERDYGTKLKVKCPADDLERVFLNLVKNSLEAVEGHSDAIVRISIEEPTPEMGRPSFLLVTITDNGPGIAPHHQSQLFLADFTTKSGPGRGMGLKISKRLVEQFGGQIEVKSPPQDHELGTSLRILLPCIDSELDGGRSHG